MALNTEKLSYSIGQVAEMAGVAQSTLRYWETVIDVLKPQKTSGGSRRYNNETVELILLVKNLLHDQGLTIKGANLYLEKNRDSDNPGPASGPMTVNDNQNKVPDENNLKDLKYIHDELIKIDKLLE
jgi:DNA-binding transcriptional MerR regulator